MRQAPPPDKSKRQKANRLGTLAEYKAAAWLFLKGYRIIEMRYKDYGGEIDIIAQKSGLIVMVEVKARSRLRDCLEAVTPSNQKRIHSAADGWLSKQRHGEQLCIRFDIVAIMPWKLPKHLKNMF